MEMNAVLSLLLCVSARMRFLAVSRKKVVPVVSRKRRVKVKSGNCDVVEGSRMHRGTYSDEGLGIRLVGNRPGSFAGYLHWSFYDLVVQSRSASGCCTK